MKIVVTSEVDDAPIGTSGLRGRCLVREQDAVGYTCYNAVLEAGSTQDIKPAFGEKFNHVYYCVYGEITFRCSEGTTVTLKTDHVVALTGHMQAQVSATSRTRLFITYVERRSDAALPQEALHLSLDQIVGTQRDVDWQHGRSRRFLRRDDGFGVSVHNTLCHAGECAPRSRRERLSVSIRDTRMCRSEDTPRNTRSLFFPQETPLHCTTRTTGRLRTTLKEMSSTLGTTANHNIASRRYTVSDFEPDKKPL